MANFRPQVTIITNETRREYANSYGKGSPYKTIRYATYQELKKNFRLIEYLIKKELLKLLQKCLTR